MTKKTSLFRSSFGVFLTAFLVGGAFVYFATPIIPSTFVRHEDHAALGLHEENDRLTDHEHDHDHEHEQELGN